MSEVCTIYRVGLPFSLFAAVQVLAINELDGLTFYRNGTKIP